MSTADHDTLHRAALRYLERFESNRARLRAVLERRVMRRASREARDDALATAAPLIDAVIADLETQGLLSDARFATLTARALRRQGLSDRAVLARLQSKGVTAVMAAEALHAAKDEDGADTRHQARIYARRKRLGPYRTPPDPARRDRDLAAMARAGFGYEDARSVLDSEDDQDP